MIEQEVLEVLNEMSDDVLEKAAAFDLVVSALRGDGFRKTAGLLESAVIMRDPGEHLIRKAASYERIMREACHGEDRRS